MMRPTVRYIPTFLLLWLACIATVLAAIPGQFVAPVERSAFSHLTSYDSLRAFLQRIDAQEIVHVESLATTSKGRRVDVVRVSSSRFFGADTTKLRVLLFAQQHGDEPSGKEALTMLLAHLDSGELKNVLSTMDLLIVPQINPDGAELRQRRTADSVDLNRNHLLLTSPETKALHDLFFTWQPHVTMDIHEYSSFSKGWSESGFIKSGDVQLGMLTNLNVPENIRGFQHSVVFPFIEKRMVENGFSFHEYIVGEPDSGIRHSTTDINDGRQSFGILGTLSFIQEGRKWKTLNDSLERRTRSQLSSIKAFLEVCSQEAAQIRAMVSAERLRLANARGQEVVLRMKHVARGKNLHIPVFDLSRNKDTIWTITSYRGVVQPRFTVTMPSAYVVPKEYTSILDLLSRHNITMKQVDSDSSVLAEEYTVDSISVSEVEEIRMPLLHIQRKTISALIHRGDLLIPTSQIQSTLLVIMLEPESAWGVVGYPEFKNVLERSGSFPILRIP